MSAGDGGGPTHTLRRFARYGRPHLGALSAGVAMRSAELVADLAQPWPLAVVIDSVIGHRPLTGLLGRSLGPFASSSSSLLVAAALSSLLLAVASGVFDYAGDRIMNGAGQKMTAAIRADVFGHVQHLPLAYHDRQSVGELSSRITTDTDRIEEALVDVFSTLVPGVVSIAGFLAAILLVNWQLGVVALVTAPIGLAVFSRYTRLTREAARIRRRREGHLAGLAVETLSGIRTVQALFRHDVHDARFADGNAATLRAGLRSIDLTARFTPLVEVVAAVGSALVLLVGGWSVVHGRLTVGALMVVVSYLRNLLKPTRSLSRLSLTLSQAAASAERVAAVLDAPRLPCPASPDIAPATPRPVRAAGRLALRDVTFGYGRGRILDGATVQIAPGERVAVLGANGAGKSSLLALLARLYDPDAGQVLLDGEPLDRLPIGWLRAQVAVVPQDTVLFAGTLFDNIGYGRAGASAAEVRAAARQALVDEFAASLPDGYDTVLGDQGVGLSGGQRQRVAIARALLRDAPVVLLDEPTSGLDLEAERTVVEALSRLVVGRTVVMVTHRPALLGLAGRRVILDGGRLREATAALSAPDAWALAPLG